MIALYLVCLYIPVNEKKKRPAISLLISSKPNTEKVPDLRSVNFKAMHGVLKVQGEFNRP